MNELDKEEFRIKLEEINHLVEQQNYKGAMDIVDSIDWRRVKNVRTLCVVGEIYAANKRYEDSKEIFLLAYHRAPIGKNILYRLIEVSLKMGDIDEAMEFYEEFLEVAPNDNTQYILKYKIYKARRASLNEQIQILEEYKEKEFTERWSYELAKLYYKAGDKEKCLDLCNEIVLWFNEGKYVMKALDLKLRMGALTGAEKEKYEQQFIPKLITPEEARALKENGSEDVEEEGKEISAKNEEDAPVIESIRMNERDINNAESIQEKISKGIRDIFGGSKRELKEGDLEEELPEEEIQEEMIKDVSSKEEFTNVPDLEPENLRNRGVEESAAASAAVTEKKEETKPDFSNTMRMPELNIPDSMKNMNINAAPPVIETPVPNTISGNPSELANEDKEFNLEDTILAAASAQGIEIPKETQTAPRREEPAEKEDVSAEESLEEKISVRTSDVPGKNISMLEDEEEEILSEEDLQQAEAEFLNGPSPKKETKSYEIPSLEPEEFISGEINSQDDEDELDELDDFLDSPEIDLPKSSSAVKKPKGMNTEVFNFQQELKKALGEKDEIYMAPLEEKEEAFAPETERELTEEEELERFIESIQPKDERDALDIIPRERKLREEEEKLFTYFVKVPGMKEQLIDALCDAQMAAADKTSRTGNIIVMGGRETGKTRLISGLIPAICSELNIEASKVAYVFAEQINDKDIPSVVAKLAGGFLVIENANQLTQETVNQLDKAMEFRTDGLTVILEDEKIGMRKLIARFPKFAKKFTSMINIPVFTNDELVNFAKVYTKENGYTIDQMGMLALYNLISINQKEDEPMNIGVVKEFIDNAIAKSQGGIRKLKRNLSKKNTDRDGYVVLYEKDFT